MSLPEQDANNYWKYRYFDLLKKIEHIAHIPEDELNSLANIRQAEINNLKYKTYTLLKHRGIQTWNKICEEAKLSTNQINYWKFKLKEGELWQEHLKIKQEKTEKN